MVWGSGFGVGCYAVCVGNVDFGLLVWWFTVNSYCFGDLLLAGYGLVVCLFYLCIIVYL